MGLFRKAKVKAEITGISDEAASILQSAPEDDPATAYMDEGFREATTVLFPNPEELSARIPLIARVGGKTIDYRSLARARVVLAIRQAIDTGEPLDWDQLNVVNDILGLSVSLKGKGRSEAVELGRRTPPAPERKSLFNALKSQRGGV